MSKSAIIIGATGQTGSYLAKELLENNYRVLCTSRDADKASWWRLQELGVIQNTERISINPENSKDISSAIEKFAPEEIYYLAGPSSVASSFLNPIVSISEIINPIGNILHSLHTIDYRGKFFNAGSTDCFGNQNGLRLDESSPMRPTSPYGVAKTTTINMCRQYRESFGINSFSGILTNHESPLRGSEFVTQKIILGLHKISIGKQENLILGNTDISRDWLWAGDAARAIRMIASLEDVDDYIVGSGVSHTLYDFIQTACHILNLSADSVVDHDESLRRPSEIMSVNLNINKIQSEVGWAPEKSFEKIVRSLIERTL